MTSADAQDLLAELAALADTVAPIVAPPGADGLLRALTETARRLFGAQACSLALLSPDETELVYTTAAGAGAQDITGMRMPSDRGVAGWVTMSGQPVAVDDLRQDSRFARDVAEDTGYVPTALLAVPVVSPRRLLGVMTLLDRDAGRPGADEDMTLLSLFADQAALALEAAGAFGAVGRLLLEALATAAAEGTTLADTLRSAADRPTAGPAGSSGSPGPELTEVAALLAELSRRGDAERRLAVRLLTEVLAYTTRRAARGGR